MNATASPARRLRPELETLIPSRMRARPIDHRGYCVPWFVLRTGPDSWDFRVITPDKIMQAVKSRTCWLCGEPLGVYMTFVIGPMCAVNRTTSEPPSHRECAEFAVRTCPFLALPQARYRDANLPEGTKPPPGYALTHNPTVCVTWTTRGYALERVHEGVLFRLLTEPEEVEFWHRGQLATRAQSIAGLMVGLPQVRAVAEAEGDVVAFKRLAVDAMRFLPAARPGEELFPELLRGVVT